MNEFEQPRQPAIDRESRRRFVRACAPAAILIVIGLIVTAAGFVSARRLEHETQRHEFERLAADRLRAVQRATEDYLHDLYAIVAMQDASMHVDRAEFTAFTEPLLARHKGIQALEWVPRVLHSKRGEFEQNARDDGIEAFEITVRDARGQLVSAPAQDEYFPVSYVEPIAGNEEAIGFDLASDPTRLLALSEARDTGKVVATGQVRLVQKREHNDGILVFIPRYAKGAARDTLAERRQALTGFVLGVFRVEDMIESAMALFEPAGIDVAVIDEAAPPGERMIYRRLSPHDAAGPRTDLGQALDAPHGLRRQANVVVGGRVWEVVCTPSERFLQTRRHVLSSVVLGAGIFLTVLLAGYVFLLIGRAARLQEVNERLAVEVGQRKQAERRQQLTMDELDHRVKNNLATVLGIVQQTLSGASSLGGFEDSFKGRIHALATVHEMLAASRWEGAMLEEILQLTVGAHAGVEHRRVIINGDAVQVPARASTPLGMAFHELTTNAVKYGALSNQGGCVTVEWTCDRDRVLRLEWVEQGGPPVEAPGRAGFGSVLIKEVIEYELRGSVSMDFCKTGLVCRMTVPFAEVDSSGSTYHVAF